MAKAIPAGIDAIPAGAVATQNLKITSVATENWLCRCHCLPLAPDRSAPIGVPGEALSCRSAAHNDAQVQDRAIRLSTSVGLAAIFRIFHRSAFSLGRGAVMQSCELLLRPTKSLGIL